ncbi:MAG TPA: dienelactone hydrolase family protein [Candidatus Bathyarchaeia archaeon]|nr:dienelactone hydrolase family protein [Candidatus Bathyarchaeia archaeon]
MDTTSFIVEFHGGNPTQATLGLLARPKTADKYPAVIVIHEIWGLVDHIKDVATRLAHEGYVALAVDLFDRKIVTNLEEGRELRQKLTEEKNLGDLNGAFNYLKTLEYVKPDHIGSIGFCMGGGFSLQLACRNPELAAAVIFYGRNPTPIDLVKGIQCPILGNYAGADMGITEQDINLLKQALAKHGKQFDIKVYPGAPHAFFNDTGERYRPEAAKDAWERTLTFFNKHLKQ